MAQSVKIEPLSNHFVNEFKRLQKVGKIGKLKEIAPLLGFKGSSGLSEILGGRSNIQPDQWETFRIMYNLSEFSDDDRNATNSETNTPLLYDGSLTVRDLINEKEARRKESQERAVIAEREKERLMTIIEANISQLTNAIYKIGVANSSGSGRASRPVHGSNKDKNKGIGKAGLLGKKEIHSEEENPSK